MGEKYRLFWFSVSTINHLGPELGSSDRGPRHRSWFWLTKSVRSPNGSRRSDHSPWRLYVGRPVVWGLEKVVVRVDVKWNGFDYGRKLWVLRGGGTPIPLLKRDNKHNVCKREGTWGGETDFCRCLVERGCLKGGLRWCLKLIVWERRRDGEELSPDVCDGEEVRTRDGLRGQRFHQFTGGEENKRTGVRV